MNEIPSELELMIKKNAENEWPDDPEMQQDEIESRLKTFELILNFKDSSHNQSDIIQGIIRDNKEVSPNDLDLQICGIEYELILYRKIQELKSNPQYQSEPIQQIIKNAESEWPVINVNYFFS